MNPIHEHYQAETRRHFFGKSALGLGTAALASLLPQDQLCAATSEQSRTFAAPHFAPKAKRAIYLFMAGAPSQIDTFDYKPKVDGMFDKDLPESVRMGQRLTTMTSGQQRFPLAPSKYKFARHGESGAWVSELLPYTAKMVNDIAIVRSLNTEAINHDPAITYICTGHQLPGRASLGSWLSYGLGSMNENLPSFVVLTSTWTGRKEAQALFNRLWGSGFLPSSHQGVALRSKGDPVLFLSNPPGIKTNVRRRMLDSLANLNQQTLDSFGDSETQARIKQYEMAFNMQRSVPELTDISDESQATLDMYGADVTKPGTFAASCLLARRMAERNVRFTQIFHRVVPAGGWTLNDKTVDSSRSFLRQHVGQRSGSDNCNELRPLQPRNLTARKLHRIESCHKLVAALRTGHVKWKFDFLAVNKSIQNTRNRSRNAGSHQHVVDAGQHCTEQRW